MTHKHYENVLMHAGGPDHDEGMNRVNTAMKELDARVHSVHFVGAHDEPLIILYVLEYEDE